jgi:hypothetical protein
MQNDMSQTTALNASFKIWLTNLAPDAGFHRDVAYVPGGCISLMSTLLTMVTAMHIDDNGGHSIRATENLPSDTVIVTLPFECAITPSIARAALAGISSEPQSLDALTERQLLCAYICAHGSSHVSSVVTHESTLEYMVTIVWF